jgi:hypothetical protein
VALVTGVSSTRPYSSIVTSEADASGAGTPGGGEPAPERQGPLPSSKWARRFFSRAAIAGLPLLAVQAAAARPAKTTPVSSSGTEPGNFALLGRVLASGSACDALPPESAFRRTPPWHVRHPALKGMTADKLGFLTDLDHWIANAPSSRERVGRERAAADIFDAYLHARTELDISGRFLTELPPCLGKLKSLLHLNTARNPLTVFPAAQLIGLDNLQDLQLSMNAEGGAPQRLGHEKLRERGYELIHFKQGNSNTRVLPSMQAKATALYTTDLDPCLAVMIMQGDSAVCDHVDSYGGSGVGRLSTHDVLRKHIRADRDDTQIFLVGANAQGSAANLRGVLRVLQELGVMHCVNMASIGNGHTSATLDLKDRTAYVGYA